MIRLLVVAWVLLGTSAWAQNESRRVLDAKRHHLGVAGLPEWESFAASPPDGTQLDLTFSARANDRESTLFVRQRDVTAVWNVLLNGRKLGTLESLAQSLLLALAVPAGALKDGDNRLTIVRPPSRLLDDIEVGEIALESRPLDEALGRATLEIAVTETPGESPLPCRLTLVDAERALAPLRALPEQRLAARTGVVYTGDGRARLGVAPGSYILYASRGFEYGVATQPLTLAAGETRRVALQLRREVPTPDLVACDTHIHTLTFSGHGDATIDERMLTIAGEGIELAVATDHNHHTNYTAPAEQMSVSERFTPVVGNEVTTRIGHFNAFPVSPTGPLPDARLTDLPALLLNIRSTTGAKVITLNHPRDLHENFTPFAPQNFDAATGELKAAPNFDCNAVEVVTSAALQSDILRLYRDWFALLNRGIRIAAIGASDTHQVSQFILGQARTYAVCHATDPAKIDVDEVCASYRAGRLLVSMGLLTNMTVDGRFHVGDLATGLGPELRVEVEVLGPSWAVADRVQLFANGVRIREEALLPTERVEKARVTWTIPRPTHDVHLVAIATGPGVTAPFWETPPPYQPTSKALVPRIVGSTNPIWIDADGDGEFTSARAYAARIVQQAERDPARIAVALAGYDEAVALHARDIARSR